MLLKKNTNASEITIKILLQRGHHLTAWKDNLNLQLLQPGFLAVKQNQFSLFFSSCYKKYSTLL